VELYVETKHPTRYGGRVERSLVDLLERHGLARPVSRPAAQVTVMSFAWTSLRRVHALAPNVPTVLLMERLPVRYRDGVLPPLVSGAGPALQVLKSHPRYVDRVHAHGGSVHCYTADDPADIEYLAALGVDALITNHPQVARQVLAAR